MKPTIIINFIAFQIIWLLCVFGAAKGYPWLGPLAVSLWLLAHLQIHRSTAAQELKLVIFAAVLGYCLDSILVLLDIMRFTEAAQLGYPSTLWMVALWVNLAMTIRHSLDWLNRRYVLTSLFGGFGGALAYWAGVKIGAITMQDTTLALFTIFSVWFFALPLIYLYSGRLQRAGELRAAFEQPMNESSNNA